MMVFSFIHRCIEDDIRCQQKENVALPTYNFIVEGEVERRTLEIEEENRRREAEEKQIEDDQIRERSDYYYDLSRTFFIVLIVGGVVGIALVKACDPGPIRNDLALVLFIIASSVIVSLILAPSFFLYSKWISW